MASSRFPGKPLASISGIPMIGHVYLRSKMSKLMKDVYVATCDEEIVKYIISMGGRAIMTKDTHERASDRTAEALLKIEAEKEEKADIVVMIQGDEPMVTPDMIDKAVQPLIEDSSIMITNLMSRLINENEHDDKNEVKVVVALNNNALYFSREAIPSRWKIGSRVPMYKQVCIIPFRREFLLKFNTLKPTQLEIAESVDMMRILEHGYQVKMVLSPENTYSVDTQEDLEHVESLMPEDRVFPLYKEKAILHA